MEGLVRRSTMHGLPECLARLGASSDEIDQVCGCTSVSSGDDSWMSFDEVLATYSQAGALVVGVGRRLAEQRDLTFLGPVLTLVRYAPSLGVALTQASRLIAFQNTGFELTLDIGEQTSSLGFAMTAARRSIADEWIEESLLTSVKICADVAGRDFRARRIELRHQALQPSAEYYRDFGCDVRFAAERDALILDTALLGRANPRHDPALYDFVTTYLSDNLPLSADALEDASTLIAQLLPSGEATLDTVARRLGCHPRTLQRRLRSRGTSFSELLEQNRRDLATHLLGATTLQVSDISRLLGYGEQSAFSHAFSRWYGTPPQQWAASHSAASESSA